MFFVGLAVVGIVLCFGGVLLFGAPYLPTLTKQTQAAMELIGPGNGKRMIELGSGDGKVLIAAAKNGWHITGYELNPILVVISWVRTRKYRRNVTIIWGDFWRQPWPDATVIFTFLLPKYMSRLDTIIVQEYGKNVKLVTFAFKVPGRVPIAEKDGVLLYEYHRLPPN